MNPDRLADVIGPEASEPEDPNPYHAPTTFSARAAPGHDVALSLRHRAGHIAERLGHLVQSVNDARTDLEGKPF